MKYLPIILRKWLSLYNEIGIFSKIILIMITIFTLLGFINLIKGWPQTLYVIVPILISYELTKLGKI